MRSKENFKWLAIFMKRFQLSEVLCWVHNVEISIKMQIESVEIIKCWNSTQSEVVLHVIVSTSWVKRAMTWNFEIVQASQHMFDDMRE